MGMLASYMMVNEETLSKLQSTAAEDLAEAIYDLEEADEVKIVSIDKLWDGLHYLLTGVSACTPIENDKLSEALVGTHLFCDDEDADFISYTKHAELEEIVKHMEAVDMNRIQQQFTPSDLAKKNIYPNIWTIENKDMLFSELKGSFDDLLSFYKENLASGMHVIVSIL